MQPTLWYNDAGGVTLGVRSRDDYLGRFEQNVAMVTGSTGWGVDDDVKDIDFFLRGKNPVVLRAPNLSQTFDAFKIEGRYGAAASLEWSRRAHLTFGPTRSHRVSLRWVAIDDTRYLDPGYYDDVGIVELQLASGISNESGQWDALCPQLARRRVGLQPRTAWRPADDPTSIRSTSMDSSRASPGGIWRAAWVWACADTWPPAVSDHDAAKQRQIYVQGSDPLSQLVQPISPLAGRPAGPRGHQLPLTRWGRRTRSRSAGVHLRHCRAQSGGRADLLSRPEAHLFKRVGIAAFTDLAQGIGSMSQTPTTGTIRFLSDAGLGVRAAHRIGDTEFVTRFDFPLFVSRPELAQDARAGDEDVAFRWVFSFEQPF